MQFSSYISIFRNNGIYDTSAILPGVEPKLTSPNH